MTVEPFTAQHHVDIEGVRIAYRTIGDPQAPPILLLHGFPGSSNTFRPLMERLADDFWLIAPDYPAFGASETPDPDQWEYSFDSLASLIGSLLDHLELTDVTLYMFDFGAPVGMRFAIGNETRVAAVIFQNGNIHADGIGPGFAGLEAYWSDPDGFASRLRHGVLSAEGIRGQHLAGVVDPTLFPADAFRAAAEEMTDPARQSAVLSLLLDYRRNIPLYPTWQAWLRDSDLPVLAVWGKQDPIFLPAGATALVRVAGRTEVVLLDAGHFAALEQPDQVADAVRTFVRSSAHAGPP